MKIKINKNNFRADASRRNRMRGFSLVELLVAVVIIAILSAISIPYAFNYTKLYRSEDQALRIMDLMREAAQLALTRHRTMRFEIDLDDKMLLIIDENGPGANDDRAIKAIPFLAPDELTMDEIPNGITKPNPPDYNDAVFASDAIGHLRGTTNVIGNNVWAAKFLSNGSVVNAAGTAPVSANLYFWTPAEPGSSDARDNLEVRAITIFGGSAAVRYWKYDGEAFVPYQ